ncbi:serine protease, partial [Verrucomicrobia bacterium]|nr:serine protease [Verrucomicrobiota bacterium]
IVSKGQTVKAKIVAKDKVNDIALLKVERTSVPLPIGTSKSVRLGDAVASIGFPSVSLLGSSPKYSNGTVSGLLGFQDDPTTFQVSLPIQPGNSGGALVDQYGNVIGVITARLSDEVSFALTGSLPQNVNFAVKSTYVLGLLESFPQVLNSMPKAKKRKLNENEIAERIQNSSALLLTYE